MGVGGGGVTVVYLLSLLPDVDILTGRGCVASPTADLQKGSSSTIPAHLRRGKGAVAKVMRSTLNPVTNTGVVMGKAAGKGVASVSNGFALRGIPTGTALIVSCVKFAPRRVHMKGRAAFGVALRRSSRTLSRIMMINCNIVGGGSLAKTISRLDDDSVGSLGISRPARTVTKGLTNMRMRRIKKRPKRTTAVHIHKSNSVATSDTPLCIISKCPLKRRGLGTVGPGSVRSVRMLGSTSTTTVCNSHTTGNIMLIAAGSKGANGIDMDLSVCTNFRGMAGGVSLVGTRRFIRFDQRTFGGGCVDGIPKTSTDSPLDVHPSKGHCHCPTVCSSTTCVTSLNTNAS